MGGASSSVRGSPAAGTRTLAYVGTDTIPVDGPANGKGIYLFEVNTGVRRTEAAEACGGNTEPIMAALSIRPASIFTP